MKINDSGERETGKGTTRTTHAQRQSGTTQEHIEQHKKVIRTTRERSWAIHGHRRNIVGTQLGNSL